MYTYGMQGKLFEAEIIIISRFIKIIIIITICILNSRYIIPFKST